MAGKAHENSQKGERGLEKLRKMPGGEGEDLRVFQDILEETKKALESDSEEWRSWGGGPAQNLAGEGGGWEGGG